MSDFLSNLAARSLASRPVVRPRLASLFEPAHRSAVGFQASPEAGKAHQRTAISGIGLEIAEVDEATDAKQSPPAFKSYRRPPSNAGEDAVDENPGNQMPSQKRMEEERRMATVSRPRALRRPSPVSNIYGLEGTRPQEAEPAMVAREGRMTELKAMEVTQISHDPAMQRSQFLPPEPSLLLPPGAAQVVASERARAGGPPSGFQEANGKPHSADIQTASSQRSLQERKPAARPLIESEPTIQVTIGRVEVRAEMAGASPRRAERQTSPVMGLEEYLRRQAKRGGE